MHAPRTGSSSADTLHLRPRVRHESAKKAPSRTATSAPIVSENLERVLAENGEWLELATAYGTVARALEKKKKGEKVRVEIQNEEHLDELRSLLFAYHDSPLLKGLTVVTNDADMRDRIAAMMGQNRVTESLGERARVAHTMHKDLSDVPAARQKDIETWRIKGPGKRTGLEEQLASVQARLRKAVASEKGEQVASLRMTLTSLEGMTPECSALLASLRRQYGKTFSISGTTKETQAFLDAQLADQRRKPEAKPAARAASARIPMAQRPATIPITTPVSRPRPAAQPKAARAARPGLWDRIGSLWNSFVKRAA